LNEKYQADVYFEARWTDRLFLSSLNLTLQQQTQLLNEHDTVRINEYHSMHHWTPQLFIENAIGQIGEQDKWFTIKKSSREGYSSLSTSSITLDICEHRRIKGVFWEKLELNHVGRK
jgi:hypothetical protein